MDRSKFTEEDIGRKVIWKDDDKDNRTEGVIVSLDCAFGPNNDYCISVLWDDTGLFEDSECEFITFNGPRITRPKLHIKLSNIWQ